MIWGGTHPLLLLLLVLLLRSVSVVDVEVGLVRGREAKSSDLAQRPASISPNGHTHTLAQEWGDQGANDCLRGFFVRGFKFQHGWVFLAPSGPSTLFVFVRSSSCSYVCSCSPLSPGFPSSLLSSQGYFVRSSSERPSVSSTSFRRCLQCLLASSSIFAVALLTVWVGGWDWVLWPPVSASRLLLKVLADAAPGGSVHMHTSLARHSPHHTSGVPSCSWRQPQPPRHKTPSETINQIMKSF